LADFGVSKILEATQLANTGVGTPFYLSPEIVRGEPYGPASDAWALGVCLYELASLRRPFEAENQLALACFIVQREPPILPSGCASDLVRSITSLLDKDPLCRLRLGEVVKKTTASAQAPAAQAKAELSELAPPRALCQVYSQKTPPLDKPKRAFVSHLREEVREQRKTSRRKWPSLRRGLRSTLSRVTSRSPAAIVPACIEVVVNPISCPAGHALERFVTTLPPRSEDSTCKCDRCGSMAALGARMWGCRMCNFDVCELCCRGETDLRVVSVDECDSPGALDCMPLAVV